MVVFQTSETLQVPPLSIPELHLSRLTPERAKRTAYIDAETGNSMTFGQWFERSSFLAAALADPNTPWKGLKRGECLGMVSPNNLDWPTVYMGTLWLGCTLSGANPQCK
jgi:acyl-CoA synthetase (AMP-forming)/AMP-acid ligase II